MGFDCQPQLVSRMSGKVWAIWSGLCWDVPPPMMQSWQIKAFDRDSLHPLLNMQRGASQGYLDLGENHDRCRDAMIRHVISGFRKYVLIVEKILPEILPVFFQFFFFRVVEIWWNMFDSPRWRCRWVIPLILKHSLPQGSSQDTNRHHERAGTSLSDSPGVWLQLHVSWQR